MKLLSAPRAINNTMLRIASHAFFLPQYVKLGRKLVQAMDCHKQKVFDLELLI